MTTENYLEQLEEDRQDLVDNLETQGITGLVGDETFTTLVPKVLNIVTTPNLQSKSVTISSNTVTNISADSQYDGLSGVEVTTTVTPNLQSKSETITTNTTTTITADSGYDGLSSVEVTTNVSGGDLSEYFNETPASLPSYTAGWFEKNYFKKCSILTIPNNSNNFDSIFANYTGSAVPKIICESNVTSLLNAYASGGSTMYMTSIDCTGLNTTNVTTTQNMFWGCSFLTDLNLGNPTFSNVTTMANMFNSCSRLTTIDLSSVNPTSSVNCYRMFNGCTSLTKIDMRSFDFTLISNFNQMFTNVPTNCLIIVADQTQKDWFTTNWSTLTNVKTVAEYNAS